MLRFKTVSCLDKACTGLEAFSLLAPAGWDFEGGIRWSVDDTMMPSTSGFKIAGDGVEMQFLPGQAFVWTSLPQILLTHPAGTRYLGATLCPLLDSSEFLHQIMLPALRPGLDDLAIIRDIQPVRMESTLGFETTLRSSGGSASSSGAGIRVRYRSQGKRYEEALYCTVTTFIFKIPVGSAFIECIFWMADNLVSIRAEPGRLDGLKGLLQTILYSFRFNPLWVEKANRIGIFLKDHQMNKPYSLRQLGREIDEAAIPGAGGLQAGRLKESGYRWIADSLCGTSASGEYYDPIQQICVRLPSGFEQAWASDLGEYLLSNSEDRIEDSGLAGAWKIMESISLESAAGRPSATSATCA
ncbi:hypothetical protein [Methanocella arvoryzae]|uniref:Uncharacterized protein n=1 Tax=Methanocella arvoryzae (strain DSM 22066 / NBRC 105507 / MRE50) TaxID=351160 RepID=Q0W8H8_METAR|nr:hypothetical protein [Methanocella arvoryzae]CAJ35315.1 hypothetical protein LRC342 [Methanocella arvoryzae MRE50]